MGCLTLWRRLSVSAFGELSPRSLRRGYLTKRQTEGPLRMFGKTLARSCASPPRCSCDILLFPLLVCSVYVLYNEQRKRGRRRREGNSEPRLLFWPVATPEVHLHGVYPGVRAGRIASITSMSLHGIGTSGDFTGPDRHSILRLRDIP